MIQTLLYTLVAAISADDAGIPKAELDNAQFGNMLDMVFAVAAATAVVFIILGGIKYSISQGNASDLEKAKNIVLYALVGLVFVIMAFGIMQFVTGRLFS